MVFPAIDTIAEVVGTIAASCVGATARKTTGKEKKAPRFINLRQWKYDGQNTTLADETLM